MAYSAAFLQKLSNKIMLLKPNLSKLSLVTLLASLSSAILAQSLGYETARNVHIVTIQANQLAMIQGQSFGQYSVLAMKNNKLEPIPFQFDERNMENTYYVPNGGIDIKGEENIFDANDELAFMLRDTGPVISDEARNVQGSNIIAELQVSHGEQDSYAYLVKGNNQRSQQDYSEFHQDRALFETSHWSMQANPENLLEWTDFYYESAPASETLLDVMKLRIIAKVLFTITITNKNVVAKVVAVKDGPVRDIVQLKAKVVIAGIPFLSLNMGLEVAPHYLGIPAVAHVPLAAAAIESPVIKVSLDFTNMPGAESRSALGDKRANIADRKLEPYEEKNSINGEHPWLALTSKTGFDILALIGSSRPEVQLGGFYADTDKANKPERFPGTGPELGYTISKLPPGETLDFRIDLIYTGGFWDNNNPENFAKAILDTPVVLVK